MKLSRITSCLLFALLTGFPTQPLPWSAEAYGPTIMIFPFGARLNGMGEVGTALADDESAVFWNPAGLGINNERWHHGRSAFFFEPLLPGFDLPDSWHSAVAAIYTPPLAWRYGSFGIHWNYLIFPGLVDLYTHEVNVSQYPGERVLALSWGMNLSKKNSVDHAVGFSIKTVSVYPDDPEHPTAGSYAYDIGYLLNHVTGFRFGTTLMNIGPAIRYPALREAHLLPFTISFAAGYKKNLAAGFLKPVSIASEICMKRELVQQVHYREPILFNIAFENVRPKSWLKRSLLGFMYSTGSELSLFNTGSFRCGLLYDYTGQRTELHWGAGVSLFNHFELDWYRIRSPNTSIARHGQWGISFSVQNPFFWKSADRQWFLDS